MSEPPPARYLPDRPFPPYAYLPGRDPHPTRDPAGHSYDAHGGAAPGYVPPEAWRTNEDYLFGVDLYNHGYLWESHEAWEGLWHPAKGDPVLAEFLQGLIQCAASALKVRMQQPRGVTRLGELGTARLEAVARGCGARFMGLEVPAFVRAFRGFVLSEPESADERPLLLLEANRPNV